ncbi:MAG: TldD/PmbA family protein [Romboutsia sp.]|nr:TldD/PmbA family protein [Romboutsia sp.]
MEFNKFKEVLLQKAKQEGFSESEVYYTKGESINISVYEEEIDKYNISKSFGLSFRGIYKDRMGYSFTEIIDEEAIDMLIKNAKESAVAIENEDEQFIYEGDKEYKSVKTYSDKLENIDTAKIIDIALNLEKECKLYSDKVVNVNGCKVSYSTSDYGITNSKGLDLNTKSNLLCAYVVPIVKHENQKYDGTGYIVASSIDEVSEKEIAKQGVKEALSKIGARSIPSKKYKGIIYNEAMVSLLKTFSSIFSGDSAQKGLSLLKDKEGEIIASELLTIIDDPLLDNGLGSAPFDDEGVATYRKEIISNGKLETLLHNLKTANKDNIKTTGNGFKSSYSSSVGVSPTNLFIQKGEYSLEELMNKLGEGVMITDFAGLHSGANSITGDFSLAAKGYYIKDGKKQYPIEQITVAGNYFDLIKDIKAIGDDLNFPMSSFGAPSILVNTLSIAGKA